jgi:hypothetical protein
MLSTSSEEGIRTNRRKNIDIPLQHQISIIPPFFILQAKRVFRERACPHSTRLGIYLQVSYHQDQQQHPTPSQSPLTLEIEHKHNGTPPTHPLHVHTLPSPPPIRSCRRLAVSRTGTSIWLLLSRAESPREGREFEEERSYHRMSFSSAGLLPSTFLSSDATSTPRSSNLSLT